MKNNFKNFEGFCGLSALATLGCFTLWIVSCVRNEPLHVFGIMALLGVGAIITFYVLAVIAGKQGRRKRRNGHSSNSAIPGTQYQKTFV